MVDKYYTPSIEEFHIGFIFEGYNTTSNYPNNDEWVEFKLELGLSEQWNRIEDYINNNQIRIKYLDNEDIKDLGYLIDEWFISKGRYGGTYKIKLSDIGFGKKISIYTKDFVRDGSGNYEELCIIYRLSIKNKSELKVLLKQLGI